MASSAIQPRLTFQAVRDGSRCADTFWWSPQESYHDTKATTSTFWLTLVIVMPCTQRTLQGGPQDACYHHAMQTQDEQTELLLTCRSIHIKLLGYGENHFSVLCLFKSGWHNLPTRWNFAKGNLFNPEIHLHAVVIRGTKMKYIWSANVKATISILNQAVWNWNTAGRIRERKELYRRKIQKQSRNRGEI